MLSFASSLLASIRLDRSVKLTVDASLLVLAIAIRLLASHLLARCFSGPIDQLDALGASLRLITLQLVANERVHK